MAEFKAPLRDIHFVLDELLDYDGHYQQLEGMAETNQELRHAILKEAAKFAEQNLAPLRRSGDEEGCTWSEEGVSTPAGFKEAYQQYVEGGWAGLAMPEAFCGQALPSSLALTVAIINMQANHAWSMYPGLTAGCLDTLLAHGTEQQQQKYLPKLVSGEWSGTMCLTESQGGSDLSFLRTKAQDNGDGSYAITGTKIFISAGEHDLTENIVHVVLARLADAPAGTKGISLFIVPKFDVTEPSQCGKRNAVHCGSIEHKMGIHANSTCVMNFNEARGYLIGNPNEGLKCMFTFMNNARIGTAAQGLVGSELAYQGALNYALEREAGRSLTGTKSPERPADRLIVHPDVRRMLLTIKALNEGNRAFIHYVSQLSDLELHGNDQQKQEGGELLALLTPIAKGFMTEAGLEAANIGVQVFGGHGYIREWGMEQSIRDARISTLYEGTTGIQALDLLGRKVMGDGGKTLTQFITLIANDLAEMDDEFARPLGVKLQEWGDLTQTIGAAAMNNADEVGGASVDYLMYSGYVILAWMWGRMATLAKEKLTDNDDVFYLAKVSTAKFYFQKLLPRTESLKTTIETGAQSLMDISDEEFEQLAEIC